MRGSKLIWFAATLSLFLSCSPTRRGASGDDDDGNGSGSGSGNGFGSACASDTVTAQQIPLDIYIELDQSSSMSDDSKWTSVTSAIAQFVSQPNLAGISVGLGYFAVETAPITCTVSSCGSDADCGSAACGPCLNLGSGGFCVGDLTSGLPADSCTVADYETPSVEIAPLPGVASALNSSMGMHSPTTGTPTVQALTGAITHAQSWSMMHAGDAVVVVLATDGEPDDNCTPEDIPSVESVATMGRMSPQGIRTFVIGVDDGTNLSDLDGIAAAGGTGSAFIVNANANAVQDFLAAMNQIRHSVLGCTYQIPVPSNGQTPDYQEVNVIYTPGNNGSPVTIPYVTSSAMCPSSGNAWYYDNAMNPTQIILCQPTCTTIEADTTGSVAIQLGCATVIP
jgi:hypothetical protein